MSNLIYFFNSYLECQVQWNDPGVKYEIYEREKQSVKLPFTVDQNGTIYVTEPLDREEKDTVSVGKDQADIFKEAQLCITPLANN